MKEFNLEKYIKVEGEDKERIKIFQIIEEINELYDKLLVAANDEEAKEIEKSIKEKQITLREILKTKDIKNFISTFSIPREKEILKKYLHNSKTFEQNKKSENDRIISDIERNSIIARLDKMADETINISEEEIKGEAFLYLLKAFLEGMEYIQEKFERILNQNNKEFFNSEKFNLEKEEKELLEKFLYSFDKYSAWINKEKNQSAKNFYNNWLKLSFYGKLIEDHYNFLKKYQSELTFCQKEINEFLNLFSFLDKKENTKKNKKELKNNLVNLTLKLNYTENKLKNSIKTREKTNSKYNKETLNLAIEYREEREKKILKKFLKTIGQFFDKNLTEITPEELKNFFSPEDLKTIKEHCKFLQKNQNLFIDCQKEINEFLNLFSFLNEKGQDSKK